MTGGPITTYIERPDTAVLLPIVDRAAARQGGLLALVCDPDADAVPVLQRLAAAVAVPIAGAVVPGLIVEGGVVRRGVLLIEQPGGVHTGLLPLDVVNGRTSDESTRQLALFTSRYANPDGGDTLLLLFDATVPDIATLLEQLYLDVGDLVHYAGMCVGSERFEPVPCVFDGTRFVPSAVLAMVLPRHPGAAMAHHYRGSETVWVATSTRDNVVETLDGRPAFEAYRDLLWREYQIEVTRETFYQYTVHFPLALMRAQGEPLVRIPVRVDDNGSVACIGEIRQQALLTVVRAIPPGATTAASEVAGQVSPVADSRVLVLYCAGRHLHLGAQATDAELAALRAAVAPASLVGALCLGEVGSGRLAYPVFQNATILALPWL